MPHLVLIDGPNYVFRAFHAIRDMRTSTGQASNAIYGFVHMIRDVLKQLNASHVAMVFDPKGGSFRQQLYPEYKAHRPPMPEDLATQWDGIFQLCKAFCLPILCVDNYEADDVIATLAKQAAQKQWQVTIVSTDKDLMQLVNEHICMLDTMKKKRYDVAAVQQRWQVSPTRLHDLLALAGDSADNIPGVPGIGPKTAVTLLQDYGDLEGILRSASQIKQKKRRENLIAFADQARLSYQLVALDEQVPLSHELDDLKVQEADRSALLSFFKKWEFRRLADEFSDSEPDSQKSKNEQASVKNIRQDQQVLTEAQLQELITSLQAAKLVSIHLISDHSQAHESKPLALAFATRMRSAWFLPLCKEHGSQLDTDHALAMLKPVLEDAKLPKCAYDMKSSIQYFRHWGIELAGIQEDALLSAYTLYPGKYTPSFEALLSDYLDSSCTAYEDIAGKGKKQLAFQKLPQADACAYACERAELNLRLCRYLRVQLEKEHRAQRLTDIELPFMRLLSDMEWHGSRIDPQALAKLSTEFSQQINILEEHIRHIAGQEVNVQSPKQIGELLFDTLQLPGGKRTKTGQWKTSQDILESLALEHEIPAQILQLRQLSKLRSTYTDALPRLILPSTQRIHTSYNQAITSTGRLSSSAPNLQNIPIRSEAGRRIRKAFIARQGHVLIAADYSQIELRLMAHYAQDQAMIAAFKANADIHRSTAAIIHHIDESAVSNEMRRNAKAVNFGILYGMSAFGLSKQLGVSRAEAQSFIDTYFQRYPAVRQFMDHTLEQARELGYVETLYGHRVFVADIHHSNGLKRAYAERTAINAPLQGSAADLIKAAMITLHKELQQQYPDAKLIMQVHDELIVEAPKEVSAQVSELMRQCMVSAAQLDVPLLVAIGCGKSWFEAHS